MPVNKLTAEVQDQIVQALRLGAHLETAAAYAGVTARTVREWRQRGRTEQARVDGGEAKAPAPKERKYVLFAAAVEKALADAELRYIGIVGKAALSQWQASAWMLERRHPERWGRRRVEIYAPEGDEDIDPPDWGG